MARLEKELASLWPAAEESDGGDGRGVMRACVLNLIVYAPPGDDGSRLDALLDEVYERNPCRALVILADERADAERLEAYVSTRCSLSTKGARQVCGEQITIEAGSAALARAASAVEPLLVPDVPVFLWWKDIPHYEHRLFGRLVDACDRLVIDSSCFDNPHSDLARLAQILREKTPHLAASDLNWARLTAWRSPVACLWDVADYRLHLNRIDRVEVVYAAEQGEIPAAAFLVTGWLASRLGWRVDSARTGSGERGAIIVMSADEGRTVEIELKVTTAEPEAAERCGGVRSLVLSADGGQAEFYVGLRAGGKLETMTRIGAGERRLSRVLDFEEQSEGRRLSGELTILARDAVYEEAVAACAGILSALASQNSNGEGGEAISEQ